MGRQFVVALLFLGLVLSPLAQATEGRAAPQCAEFNLGDVATSSSGVAVEPGACLIVFLGYINPETTLGFDIEVLDDAMDVLLFDQNSISVYKNGQNYRNSFFDEGTLESFVGTAWFDWATPFSTSPRNWYIVFDNSPHDGDEGMGDQGGMTSRFKIQMAPVVAQDYPFVHDTFMIDAGQRVNLADFAVDSGTELSYWIHPLSGDGEFFIQSDNQLDGDLKISGTSFDQFTNPEKNYANWTVPQYLDRQNLNMMVETDSTPFHFSIEAWFEPVLNPQIVDYVNGSTTIGESVVLDASSTPNSLNQIDSLSWDFDSDMIMDSEGMVVEASWSSPGLKTINLTATSGSGEVTMVSHQIQVADVTDPVAVISGSGMKGINGEWRLLRTSDLVLQATNSYDDHGISSASWNVDGTPTSSGTQFTVSWSEIGTYTITLIVTDPSGNTNSTDAIVVVYDADPPRLLTNDIKEITQVYNGDEVVLSADADFDVWESEADLRFTWDLDLERDSNGDGDSRNDVDYEGKVLKTKFTKNGKQSFALTVYDPSNNTDFEVFSIQVVDPPSDANLFAIVTVVFFVILIVAGVTLFGYRSVQRRQAVEILLQNNFTLEQANARIYEISKTTKLPTFAKAEQIAGISEGSNIKTPDQLQTDAKADEMARIYGNDGQTQDPYAGFRPVQNNPVSNQIANEALAAFADEKPTPPPVQHKAASGKVKSGGIALPTTQKSPPPAQTQSHNLIGDCNACGKKFSLQMPPGVNSAVVNCPSCGSEQLFER